MDGDFVPCRKIIGDLVRRELIARTRQCKFHRSVGDETKGSSTDGDRSVFVIGLVTGEKTRPYVKDGGVFAVSAFSNEARERMEGSQARVLNRLAFARMSENFEMRDRHPVRSRCGVVFHAAENAIKELPRRDCGCEERGGREAMEERTLGLEGAEGSDDFLIIEVCRA